MISSLFSRSLLRTPSQAAPLQCLQQYRFVNPLRRFSTFDNGSHQDWVAKSIDEKICKKDDFVQMPPLFNGVQSGWKASRDGRLQNTTGRVKRGYLGQSGYLYIWITAWKKSVSVHRLIALTFLAKQKETKENAFPGERLEVDHIDGDKQNNAAENLQWVTRKEHAQKTAASLQYPGQTISSAFPVYARNLASGEEIVFQSISAFAQFLETPRGQRMLAVARLADHLQGVIIKGWIVKIDRTKFQMLNGEYFKRLYLVCEHERRVTSLPECLKDTSDMAPYIEVSNRGRVRYLNGRIDAGYPINGYLYATLNRVKFRIHRLVAEAFHQEQKQALLDENAGNKPLRLQVDHKDRNKLNNREENLQWVTPPMHALATWKRRKSLDQKPHAVGSQ
uniref:HNH nuclease domain-containing protein n=1 Tax=Chromera velia CCMP2878 TaxID=1169474 RepID=A0A0G4GUP3_9ALVE|eukprot:Cvel_23441.t1-p1 / transcript=Cvel_23441.t1 / gene=Cvel_23441 / organism=Chromera_velia_CCMP2878 / gene_product=hypothetical protein / transcript_product=hypothetical protein / location=Cvel_scaffold2416:9248-10420(-) / protein_length=391 / sequence_SO=supercontig / SO=protein_coding / is_pseudo=false